MKDLAESQLVISEACCGGIGSTVQMKTAKGLGLFGSHRIEWKQKLNAHWLASGFFQIS